jgi:hypothetical protein
MNKKLLKSLFAVVLAFVGMLAISNYANAGVKGDVNGDGHVTAADVTCIYDVLLGNSNEYQATSDVNGDGFVTAADVTVVYDILLGNVPLEYDKVYILGQVNGNSWATNIGVEMTTEDGKIYTATITTQTYSYFSFTTALAETADDWDSIAPYRFGAIGDGDVLVTEENLGHSYDLATTDYQAFKIAAGEFTLTLDLEAMTLRIEGTFEQQPEPGNGWYLIGTPNNWSTSDKSYPFVQDAQNENVYSIHVDNVSGDFWFKIAAEGNYDLADFWSGNFLSAATDGESALSGNLVQGNQGAFCIPGSYNCTYLDITIDVENLTYTITTDGQAPEIQPGTADWYLVGTCNNWSTTDMSYPFVQSTENESVYSIHVDNVSGDFWFKIAAGSNYSGSFWSGTFLSAATDGESALSGNLVLGNQGAFCMPASYNCTYLDITIDVQNMTYSIATDGQP